MSNCNFLPLYAYNILQLSDGNTSYGFPSPLGVFVVSPHAHM